MSATESIANRECKVGWSKRARVPGYCCDSPRVYRTKPGGRMGAKSSRKIVHHMACRGVLTPHTKISPKLGMPPSPKILTPLS